MATGRVKFFNPNTGYGFIVPDEGGRDLFVHISKVEKSGLTPAEMAQGVPIEYQVVNSQKSGKPEAVDLKILPGEPMRPKSGKKSSGGSYRSGRMNGHPILG